MQLLLPVLLLTLAATSDSFVIGFNYGIKDVRIHFYANAFISLLCFAGTFASMLAGRLLSNWITDALARYIGGSVLLILGVYMMLCALRPRCPTHALNDPLLVDKDNSKTIELRESLMVGLLLSMNNMGLGIGVGLAGLPILVTSLVCGAASFAFIGASCWLGRRMRRLRLSKALEIGSALLVLCLGISEFVL